MSEQRLCPYCKTGKISYELDRSSAVCPYLACHNGKKCTMYVPMENAEEKRGIKQTLKKLLKAISNKAKF